MKVAILGPISRKSLSLQSIVGYSKLRYILYHGPVEEPAKIYVLSKQPSTSNPYVRIFRYFQIRGFLGFSVA
jgi:hypothetical protein